MTITRANVESTKAFIRARVGNPYVYGRPTVEHPCWAHRLAALLDLIVEWFDRKLAGL